MLVVVLSLSACPSPCEGTGCGGDAGATGGGTASTGGGASDAGATGGGGGGAVDAGPGVEPLCTQYAQAVLGFAVRCGSLATGAEPLYLPVLTADCVASLRRDVPSHSALHAEVFDACFTRLATQPCTTPRIDCPGVLTGTQPSGAACFDDDECVTGTYCDTATTCPATCVPRVAVGQPVSATQQCVELAYPYAGICRAAVPVGQGCGPLSGQSTPQRCADPLATCAPSQVCVLQYQGEVDASCTTDQDCRSGAYCAGTKCKAYADADTSCQSAQCRQGSFCNPAQFCQRYDVAPLGAFCGGPTRCEPTAFCSSAQVCALKRGVDGTCTPGGGECQAGLACSADPNAGPGVCHEPIAVGDPCVFTTANVQCVPHAYCFAAKQGDTGVCANQKGESASCTYSFECLSNACSGGHCEKPACEAP